MMIIIIVEIKTCNCMVKEKPKSSVKVHFHLTGPKQEAFARNGSKKSNQRYKADKALLRSLSRSKLAFFLFVRENLKVKHSPKGNFWLLLIPPPLLLW